MLATAGQDTAGQGRGGEGGTAHSNTSNRNKTDIEPNYLDVKCGQPNSHFATIPSAVCTVEDPAYETVRWERALVRKGPWEHIKGRISHSLALDVVQRGHILPGG